MKKERMSETGYANLYRVKEYVETYFTKPFLEAESSPIDVSRALQTEERESIFVNFPSTDMAVAIHKIIAPEMAEEMDNGIRLVLWRDRLTISAPKDGMAGFKERLKARLETLDATKEGEDVRPIHHIARMGDSLMPFLRAVHRAENPSEAREVI